MEAVHISESPQGRLYPFAIYKSKKYYRQKKKKKKKKKKKIQVAGRGVLTRMLSMNGVWSCMQLVGRSSRRLGSAQLYRA